MARKSLALDEAMMKRAVSLARRGLGATYPNPSVGALVVRGGEVIARGRTAATGGPHAEARALTKAGAEAKGSTLYVTLEPCSHHGRTPPCTGAIVDAGVRRVVYGVQDPARHASGRALEVLSRAGIRVDVGVAAAQCEAVHEHYLHHVTHGRPFVTLKTAASLDGRLSVSSGDSKWITSPLSRAYGHRLRARHHAIAVGIGTVLADDPALTVRMARGEDPTAVVFDSSLRLVDHLDAKLVRAGTIVLHTASADPDAAATLAERGVVTVRVRANKAGRVSPKAALRALGRRDVRSLMVEGGGALIGTLVEGGLWDRWFWFTAPKVLGEGTSAVGGVSWSAVARTPAVSVASRRTVGDDLLTVLEPSLST